MNPIPTLRTTKVAESNIASVGSTAISGEFTAAKTTGSLQSSAMQTGEKIASMTDVTNHAVKVSEAVSVPSLRDYGTPHPNTRFASNLDPVATYHKLTDIGLPDGTATKFNEHNAAKLARPDPSTYLDPQFMKQHLALFDEGAVSFITTTAFRKFTAGFNNSQFHGRSDGLFVLPAKWAREMLKEVSNDPSVTCHPDGSRERNTALIEKIERKMGIPAGWWSQMSDEENPTKDPKKLLHENLFALFIEDPKKLNLRFTAGVEQGANIEWRPGGYTINGIPEACVDKVGSHDGLAIPVEGLEHVLSTWHEVHYGKKEPTA